MVAATVLSGLLIVVAAQTASAHAELLSTTPEDGAALEHPPTEVVLTFNEPVQLVDGGVRLFIGADEPVVVDAQVSDTQVVAPFPADAEDGRYALSYRLVSADGHPISGAISFTIGDAGGSAPVPVADQQSPQATQLAVSVLTGLQYVSLLVFAGLNLFDRIVLRNRGRIDARSALVLRCTGAGALVASILLVPVSALNVTGSPLQEIISPAAWRAGLLWGPVTAAAVVLLGVVGAYALATRTFDRRQLHMLPLLPALLALSAPVLVGHSQLIAPRALMVAADLGHLLVGSFWAGGVVGLLLVLAAARVVAGAQSGPVRAAQIVERFSALAAWTVAILAISGTIMAVRIVGTFSTLVSTGYGWTLLAKLGVLAPVLGIAAYNRFRLLPAVSARPAGHPRWRHLVRTLQSEAALLVVVLIITGFLTNLSPTHEHHDMSAEQAGAAEPASISAVGQGLAIDGVVEPAQVGDNDLSFTLRYEDEPATPEEVAVQVSLPEHDLGPFEVSPELDPSTGEYTAELSLPVAGEWQVEVVARVSQFAEPIVTVPVTVP